LGPCRRLEFDPTLIKSSLGQVFSEQGTLSGQDMVTRMGSFMSGHPNCIITCSCLI
jgi:hypothetical protein